jgi:hypothetical protein
VMNRTWVPAMLAAWAIFWAIIVLPRPAEQRHTATFPRPVVVHYRWHPLFRQSLTLAGNGRPPTTT